MPTYLGGHHVGVAKRLTGPREPEPLRDEGTITRGAVGQHTPTRAGPDILAAVVRVPPTTAALLHAIRAGSRHRHCQLHLLNLSNS